MKVAIVAPYSSSGERGGAERFFDGLIYALNRAGAAAEIVGVNISEATFEDILASYERCAALDLSSYDLVISTKAPTYNVRHSNHIVYLVHTVRVFYDMFHANFPVPSRDVLAQQSLIHELDTSAFRAAKKVYAIGHEVANRLASWNGIRSEVLHPPIEEEVYRVGPLGDYFFLPGRLHPWKRVDLAINAVRGSEKALKLLIAGTGEAEGNLKSLAAKDPRIEFLGRVAPDRLKELYAHARAVIFTPIREDYGYITVEAFASGKPVITCSDSGEPLHFVRHGRTGLVARPDPSSLRAAIETLHDEPHFAEDLGKEALAVSKRLSWSRVAAEILEAASGNRQKRVSPQRTPSNQSFEHVRVAVLDMQPITPAVGGGRQRLLGLYHGLGNNIECWYVGSYDWEGEPRRDLQLTPTLRELTVPLSPEHHAADRVLAGKAGMATTIDISFPMLGSLSENYLAAAREAISWADVVILSHPWVFPSVAEMIPTNKFVIYDSHNVEAFLRAQLLNLSNDTARQLLQEVIRTEDALCKRSELILACSYEDMSRFVRLFDLAPSKMDFAPNGVFTSRVKPKYGSDKLPPKQALNVKQDAVIGFFIGSNYGPNVEAASVILEQIAPGCPEVLFVIAGGVCDRLESEVRANVRLVGQLSDDERNMWLGAADIAINPMLSGSGTNIKMFDFASAGLPIVTTPLGARGIIDQSGYGIRLVSVSEMPSVVAELARNPELREALGRANRQFVEAEFCWEKISARVGNVVRRELIRRKGSISKPFDQPSQKKILHFSTVGQKCGIGEYTRHLITALKSEGCNSTLLTSDSPGLTPQLTEDDGEAHIAWFFDNRDWSTSHLYSDFERLISNSKTSGAIIQHHPGFLPPSELLKLIGACKRANIRSVVVAHAIDQSQVSLFRQLAGEDVLVVSHKAADLTFFAQHDICSLHIPHAIPDFPLRRVRTSPKRKEAPVIVSNGFLRAHKGFETLIEAFSIFNKHCTNARLRLLTPEYQSSDSADTLQRIRVAAETHGISHSVEIDLRYREKEELIGDLADADLAIFPYMASAEGGSGAAADALAAGLPIIVSPSKVFDDLRQVGLTIPPEPSEISDAMLQIFQGRSFYRQLAFRSFAYAERNNWKSVAQTFVGLLN